MTRTEPIITMGDLKLIMLIGNFSINEARMLKILREIRQASDHNEKIRVTIQTKIMYACMYVYLSVRNSLIHITDGIYCKK